MQLIVPPDQGHNMWEGFFQCRELVDFVVAQTSRTNRATGQPSKGDPSKLVELALARAGENTDQLRKALDDAPEDQKEGVRFLIHRSIGTLAKTLAQRGDPASIFSGEIVVTLTERTE